MTDSKKNFESSFINPCSHNIEPPKNKKQSSIQFINEEENEEQGVEIKTKFVSLDNKKVSAYLVTDYQE